MKRKATAIFAAAALAATAGLAVAQGRGAAEATYSGKKVSVDYGQPTLRGRDMLAKASVGMVWRFGKDAATTLTTEADLHFGDVTVPKGSYSLFAKKVGDGKWHLIVNKQTGQWGTVHDAEKDLAEIPLQQSSTSSSVESFTIELAGEGSQGSLKASWGSVALSADFMVH